MTQLLELNPKIITVVFNVDLFDIHKSPKLIPFTAQGFRKIGTQDSGAAMASEYTPSFYLPDMHTTYHSNQIMRFATIQSRVQSKTRSRQMKKRRPLP